MHRVTEARDRLHDLTTGRVVGFSSFFIIELLVEILAILDMIVCTLYLNMAFDLWELR